MIDSLIISFESEGILHTLNFPTKDINLPYNLATAFTELIKHSDANAEMIIEQLEVKFPSIKAGHCDELENDNQILANEKRNLDRLYNELNEKSNALENTNMDLRKQRDEQKELINRFMQAEFVEMEQECQYAYKSLQKTKRKVGISECSACPHLMKADVFGKKCVLCAYLYDNKKKHDAREMMATDE